LQLDPETEQLLSFSMLVHSRSLRVAGPVRTIVGPPGTGTESVIASPSLLELCGYDNFRATRIF
jgi:hypothetical protein